MILWNDDRRLVLKMSQSERIYAPAVPLNILAFSVAVTTVVSRVLLGASAQHMLE